MLKNSESAQDDEKNKPVIKVLKAIIVSLIRIVDWFVVPIVFAILQILSCTLMTCLILILVGVGTIKCFGYNLLKLGEGYQVIVFFIVFFASVLLQSRLIKQLIKKFPKFGVFWNRIKHFESFQDYQKRKSSI